MRKEELAMSRQKFDIICQASAENAAALRKQDQLEKGLEVDVSAPVESALHLMPSDVPLMFSDQGGESIFGDEAGVSALVAEYDINENGYLEWEEFVNLYDDLVPRPTNLDIHVMRVQSGEEDSDVSLGSVYLSLDDLQQGQLSVHNLVDENESEILGGASADTLASISLRVRVFNLSSENGVSQDPATDALSLLVRSTRVKHDMECCKHMGPNAYPVAIILRQYDPEIAHSPQRHFRVFVCDNQITAISQRHHELYFHQLNVGRTTMVCRERIIHFFWTSGMRACTLCVCWSVRAELVYRSHFVRRGLF